MLAQDIIRNKRDGMTLDPTAIAAFVRGLVDGSVGDAQAAAFAMAVYFNGMTMDERAALTLAMRDSGRVLSWTDLDRPVVDKHSTGGVGDTVSLILAPLLASCGAAVPMISGRGLGHTGGTLDKLEAIPGYDVAPSTDRLRRIVGTVGCAIVGATADLAPADGRLYAIRDVTATVESIALITASILAKKLAAGLDALVMDVKVGSGAFMPTMDRARELAASIVDVGRRAGLATRALVTDMDEPLAPCAGNANETRLAIAVLRGEARPARLVDVTMALGAELLVAARLATDRADAASRLDAALASGAAAERFAAMAHALGGPADLLGHAARHLPSAPFRLDVRAPSDGIVHAIDVRGLGMAVVALGGGRRQAGDRVDPGVGLDDLAGIGTIVRAGDPLAVVVARDADGARAAAAAVAACYGLADDAGTTTRRPVVIERT